MTHKIRLFFLTLLVNTHSLFAASFPAFEGTVRVPIGNHGSASATLLDPNHLKTTHSYLPHSEETILDIQSKSIETRKIGYNGTDVLEKKQYPPADQGGLYLPWRHQLLKMINDVTWIQQNLILLGPEIKQSRTPEMEAVLNYLNAILAAEDTAAPDSVDVFQGPTNLRRGISYSFMIEYLAHADRDILLEVFDGQWKYLEGVRVRVPVGRDIKTIEIKIPADVPTPQNGFVAAKLVPADAPWTEKLAEASVPVNLQNLHTIASVSMSWVDVNVVPSVSIYISYYCPGSCEVQTDIFDKNGQWVAGRAIPADAPFIQDGQQFSSLKFEAPPELYLKGETYHYTVKIQPTGAPNQPYDQFQGTFVAGH